MFGSQFLSVNLSDRSAASGPLAASAQYYLKEDHTTSWKKELGMQAFILAVCVSGAYLYFDPARAYAERVGQSDLAWLYIASTCFQALATLYVATDIFFKMHAASDVPERLKSYLKNPQTRRERYFENATIFSVSGLSSVVLASILFRFSPAGWPVWAVATLASIIFVDNTVLHFLPVKLMSTQKIWRAPFLPAEYLIKYFYEKYQYRSFPKPKSLTLERVTAEAHIKLKQAIIARISLAQTSIRRSSLEWSRKDRAWNVEVPIKNLSSSSTPLEDILSYAEPSKPYFEIHPIVKEGLQFAFAVMGAVWIWACTSGYYAAPFNQFNVWTGSSTAATVITALPIYTLSVLLAFFGVMFVGQAYQYLTTWGDNISKIPVEVKLFPKTFVGSMVLNTIMAGFGYAAAVELVYSQITYEWAKPFIPFLLGCAYSGVAYAGFMSVLNFVLLMNAKMAQFVAASPTRELMQLNEKIDQLKTSVLYMDGDYLEQELSAKSLDQRKLLLGMEESDYRAQINHKNNYDDAVAKQASEAARPSVLHRLFCCGRSEPEADSLLGGAQESFSA